MMTGCETELDGMYIRVIHSFSLVGVEFYKSCLVCMCRSTGGVLLVLETIPCDIGAITVHVQNHSKVLYI